MTTEAKVRTAIKVLLMMAATTTVCGGAASADPADDPYVWLEDATSTAAQAWVKDRNAAAFGALSTDARFASAKELFKTLLTADDRLPDVSLQGGYAYNFWRDQAHAKGVWRRVTLDGFTHDPIAWETLLDVDHLAAQEKEDWVWSGVQCLPPAYQRCLVSLSRGGKDAVVVREFDVGAQAFVAGGFVLPEAKSWVTWLDAETLLVGTDWGSGTMTTSGYPAEARLWKRGTDWRSASLVYRGQATSVSMNATVFADPTGTLQIIEEDPDFFTARLWLRGADGTLTALPLPLDVEIQGAFRGSLLVRLRSSWAAGGTAYPAGSLVAYEVADGTTRLIYTPSARSAVRAVHTTKDQVVITVLESVISKLVVFTKAADGSWQESTIQIPGKGTLAVTGADPFDTTLLATFESFLQPRAVYRLAATGDAEGSTLLRQAPARFDASDLTVDQYEAVSKDGTKVPYFLVHRKDLAPSGASPTLLYGYGGFEISMTPTYSAGLGGAWLAKGGVYALANIRGGGEFGPAWHQAAVKHNRQRSHDDFIAVAEDLIARHVTDQRHLGIRGGSNGGLLVGTVMVERPDLFQAVVCEVPLLDMLRFPLLGAGASWEGEYGDPAVPADRAVLLSYSPYQNLKATASYPKPFFVTSTDDDRVTPAHARKMAAKMIASDRPVLFYETAEGGHATPASADGAATTEALIYTYLYQQLMGTP